MKTLLIITMFLNCLNLFSQSRLSGKIFTHSFPITTSVNIETLRFVNDSICILTYGSLNYAGTSITLNYSLVSELLTFKGFKQIEGINLTENMNLIELNYKQSKKLKKKSPTKFKSEYWSEKSANDNQRSNLYLKSIK